MCELFGASLKKPVNMKKYLDEFYSHSRKHPHGWGLAVEGDGGMKISKSPECAVESEQLAEILSKLQPEKNLLAHIRYATVGAKKADNCHPFNGRDNSGREWTLIHNGTIYSGMELMKYLDVQQGDTDSERVFLYLIDSVNEALEQKGSLSREERFGIVEKLVYSLSSRNKLNLMIFDGEVLYVHQNMSGTLYFKQTDEGYYFSTQPLDGDEWFGFPMCRACAYKNGEKLFEGSCHGNEFIPTLDYISAMDAMNI